MAKMSVRIMVVAPNGYGVSIFISGVGSFLNFLAKYGEASFGEPLSFCRFYIRRGAYPDTFNDSFYLWQAALHVLLVARTPFY